MENVREHRNLDLVAKPEKLAWLAKQPTYRLHRNIHENLVAVERWSGEIRLSFFIIIYSIYIDINQHLQAQSNIHSHLNIRRAETKNFLQYKHNWHTISQGRVLPNKTPKDLQL